MKLQQQAVDAWIKTHGVRYFNESTNMILLMEEVGELARWIARIYGEQSFKESEKNLDHTMHIKEEMADVLFVLICLANQMEIDLEKALDESIEKKTKRDQSRHVENKKLNS
jgi:NTP pyrophosphatase (non-canonical NTP hydrolase)